MSKDENIGTRSAGTEEKEVIVSKLSDLVVGVWEKASDKFRTNADAEAKEAVVDAALTDLDTRLNSVSGEVEDKADLDHSHGFLTNEGTINSEATIASGDHLVITDTSELGKVNRSTLAFDGVSADKALTRAGTWETMLGSAAITNAINALDVASVGGAGKYISAISETDGKISATATMMDTTPTASSTNAVTSGGIKTALDGKANDSDVVHKTGTETISGVKTFSNTSSVFSGNAATATVADSVSTAIGSGEIKLLGVANNVAGNYQPKMHPNIRAYYDNNSNGNILMVGPERGTRGAADKGGIRLSGGKGYFTQLQTADFTADRWHKLPDESGNLAITSGTYPNMSVGTADYASAAKSGSALEQAIAPDADVSLILYGDSNYSTVKALYNAGKKLYLLTGGSIQPSGRFEYRIPLTQITYDANKEVNAFYFEVSQDDRNGASEVGSVAVYRLDSTGWTMSAKQVGYAVNAGAAVTYTSGGGIDTALQGKMSTDGSNATNVAGGNIIRSLNDWSNPADAEMIAAASSSGQGKYTLIKLWDTYFKNKVNQIIPKVGYMGANGMTAMQKNGTTTMPGNNCKICLDENTYNSFGYNGFTCLGHYKPTGSGQKYYGWCGNYAQNGGIVEIDFDYTATVEIARGTITSLPESMDVSFAAMTDNNAFKYGFALDASTIFTTSQETMRFEVSGTTSKQIKGHARLIGRGSAASTQTGTRIFVGAVQITSPDHFLVLNVNNIRIKVTRGDIYDVTYL